MRLVRQLQASTIAERGYALSPDEQATTLGAMTTLPGDSLPISLMRAVMTA